MKLVPQSSPYIRKYVSVKRMMLDVVIALMPVTIFAMIQNGWSGIYVFLISIVTMILLELLCHMFIHWPKEMKFKELFTKDGFSKVKSTYTVNNIIAPLISALIYSLILPAGCSPYVVLIGAVFGILVGKMLFGGLGSNIFNPAAVGRIFVGVCFGTSLGEAYKNLPTYIESIGATPLGSVKGNLANTSYSLLDCFLGNIPGSMGEVSTVLILVGAIYLFVRHSADLRSALSYFLSFAVISFAAVCSYSIRNNAGNIFNMWLYQLLTGGLVFGAVFMITDPVTSPVSKFGRVAFGTLAGVITALIRFVGAYPEGVAFSILIANMFTPCIDYFMRGKPNTYTWKQCLGLAICIIAICGIVIAAV